ncbi:MAG: hypothetical protein ABFD50_04685 [Smithella sp.]
MSNNIEAVEIVENAETVKLTPKQLIASEKRRRRTLRKLIAREKSMLRQCNRLIEQNVKLSQELWALRGQ